MTARVRLQPAGQEQQNWGYLRPSHRRCWGFNSADRKIRIYKGSSALGYFLCVRLENKGRFSLWWPPRIKRRAAFVMRGNSAASDACSFADKSQPNADCTRLSPCLIHPDRLLGPPPLLTENREWTARGAKLTVSHPVLTLRHCAAAHQLVCKASARCAQLKSRTIRTRDRLWLLFAVIWTHSTHAHYLFVIESTLFHLFK
jgi:hypothetical protein